MLLALVFVANSIAHSQQQASPRIGYIYPAGGQQGAAFEITIGGQYLDNVATARVTGSGIKATVIEHVKPITQQQFNMLRDKLKELQDKRLEATLSGNRSTSQEASSKPTTSSKPTSAPTWTADDEKMLVETRKKIATFIRRPSSPAIGETVTLHVTIAPDAGCGDRELRLLTPNGLSNPLAFNVGQLPESTRKSSKDMDDPRDLRALRTGNPPRGIASGPPTPIALPTIINGQILPGSVERYRFHATRGQRLVVATHARELIPYIADAVPGWFQANVTLYDAAGHELTGADHFQFHPDPVLYFEVPKDGDYELAVRDSLYRGREDFVYRIAIGELPYVKGAFPLGGRAGAQTAVEIMGWNLPATTLTQDAKDLAAGVYPLSGLGKDWGARYVRFATDSLPEVLEKEPNHSRETAQSITLPVVVNGRIDRPGEWDVFRFDGRAGDEIVAEVTARRLGSPLDSVLRLTDAAGKQLAFNDDHEDKGSGLSTHHADSYLRFKLPAAGTYYLHLGDVQQQGGPEYAYRLRVSAPQPDFELRITPSGINVRGGGSVPVTVYALRKDGFSGEIELVLKDAPAGFVLNGGRLPAGQDQVRVTLTAPTNQPKDPVPLHIEGRAKIQGREVVKPAVPAEDLMQAFAWRHLVPAQELEAAVTSRFGSRATIRIISPLPIKIPAGKSAKVLVGLPQNMPFGTPQLELNEPPAGLSIQGTAPAGQGTEITLQCDAAKLKPGFQGNLIVSLFMAPRNPTTAQAARPANQRRASLGALPAIPFEIVEP